MLEHQWPPKRKTLLICQPWISAAPTPPLSLKSFHARSYVLQNFLQKQLSERNANSHHQVCHNLKKKRKKEKGMDNKSERYIQEDLMQN